MAENRKSNNECPISSSNAMECSQNDSTHHIHILSGQCERIVGGGGQSKHRTFRIIYRIVSYRFGACYRIAGVVNIYSNAFDVTHRCADHILQFALPINACTCHTQRERKQQNYFKTKTSFRRREPLNVYESTSNLRHDCSIAIIVQATRTCFDWVNAHKFMFLIYTSLVGLDSIV